MFRHPNSLFSEEQLINLVARYLKNGKWKKEKQKTKNVKPQQKGLDCKDWGLLAMAA